MTEPTDDELDTVLCNQWPAFSMQATLVRVWVRAAMRDALAKWGTPPAVEGEPLTDSQPQAGAVPMSHEDAKALVRKYGNDPLHLVLQVERHHGIDSAPTTQPAPQQEAREPLTDSQIMASIGRNAGKPNTLISESRPLGQQWDQVCNLVRDIFRERYAPAPQQEAQEPYSIDIDPQGIRALVADAITGALAFGAQGTNAPPDGHWLAPFWAAARAEREAAPVADLHPKTSTLVQRFAAALTEKLAAAEKKYGYSDGWASPDWMGECRQKQVEHLAKGDPRDVAAYCAFLWHHRESTTAPASQGDALDAEQHEMDARHAAIYRWMLSHVADVLSIFDNWLADGEADTDELHDALAARAARAPADSVLEDAARLEFEMQHGSAIAAARKQGGAT